MEVTSDSSIHPILPLSPAQFAEQSICPICKKMVYINRHDPGLCELIENNKRKEQKVAHDAIKKANRLDK